MIVVSIALVMGITAVFAQEQEGKLIDRLLKPNLALANPAQDKQFSATGASIGRPVQTKTFFASGQSPAKSFSQTRVLSPGEFGARHFRTGDSPANLAKQSQLNQNEIVQVAWALASARIAPESVRRMEVSQFVDNRPFLGQGKNQKALSTRDTPLTIEQVRELLNKNK